MTTRGSEGRGSDGRGSEGRGTKRLVICCDGTWNRPDSPNITNIEKIARTVQTDPSSSGGIPQLVYYLSGVGGAGYETDRILGGAFGFGLFNNMLAGYRFLAQNYEPGDEIFVFGFSRGAFTARTLVGMIGYVGLITKRALVDDQLSQARDFYRGRKKDDDTRPPELVEWRATHTHPTTPVAFVGVFDTVGALGVPGAMFLAPRFHNLQLSDEVACARHALAIDEYRLKFEPSLWTAKEGAPGAQGVAEDGRVKQVWFRGAHSDVGGGYAETGLSDSALLWMATEAHAQGLVFDVPLLTTYVASGRPAEQHNPLKPLFHVHNLLIRLKMLVGLTRTDAFVRRRLRRLDLPGRLSLRVASTALEDLGSGGYSPSNLAEYTTAAPGPVVEPVVRLPQDPAATATLLEPLGQP
ncbi:MAG TPA: DUF2235 domain-containing protein [Nocardioidaceae bacterium]|nr:DUF2235 domain-containing protein [Nocardioidaceae bacterium]